MIEFFNGEMRKLIQSHLEGVALMRVVPFNDVDVFIEN